MKLNIDLGKVGSDCGPVEVNRSEPYYPAFHYEGTESLEIPKSGTMTIRFRKAGSSESEDGRGKEHYSCTVEVLEIVSVEGNGEQKRGASKETENALDSIKAAREAAQGEEEE